MFSSLFLLAACGTSYVTQDNGISFDNLYALEGSEIPVFDVPDDTENGAYVHYKNGNLRYKTWINNGCIDRYLYTYYDNGNLKMFLPLRNCKGNGIIRSYYSNGNLENEMGVRDGYLYGPFKRYHNTSNNGIYMQGTMSNGVFEGLVEQYDDDGELVKKGEIRNGKIYPLQ